jgi:hypothetical protein
MVTGSSTFSRKTERVVISQPGAVRMDCSPGKRGQAASGKSATQSNGAVVYTPLFDPALSISNPVEGDTEKT